jgi:cystathionine gamma-synthase
MKLATQLVQAGINRDEKNGAISTPIYQTSTFRHPSLGQTTGFDYSRSGNPTRLALEENICALEGGKRGLAFASGMAAISAVMGLFRPDDHILVSDDTYGGTYRLFTPLGAHQGLEFSFLDFTDLDSLDDSITLTTRAVFVETPSNPLMKIIDLQALVHKARQYGLLVIVDNTLFTPSLQQPLAFGVDIVVHSAFRWDWKILLIYRPIWSRLWSYQDKEGGKSWVKEPN